MVIGGHLENIVLGEDITAPAMIYLDPSGGKAYKAVATDTAKAAQAVLLVSGVADDQRQAHWPPFVIEWPSSLTPGVRYYLSDTDGGVDSTPGTNSQFVGDVTADGLFSVNIAPFAAAGGGGSSDALGTGFTSGGGSGTIPDATVAALGGTFQFNGNSGNEIISMEAGAVRMGAGLNGDNQVYLQLIEGAPFLQVAHSDPGGAFTYYDSTSDGFGIVYGYDKSSTLATNDRSITDVSAVKLLGLWGLNKMTSIAKEALTPSEGWEVYDTDLDGKCIYDGVKWLRISQKSAPTIAVGAGAGTGATVTVDGNDIEGIITLTAGTSPTTSATVFTLTFFDSFSTAPKGVMLVGASETVATLPAGRQPFFLSVSTTTFVVENADANGLVSATVYKYAYRVIQ